MLCAALQVDLPSVQLTYHNYGRVVAWIRKGEFNDNKLHKVKTSCHDHAKIREPRRNDNSASVVVAWWRVGQYSTQVVPCRVGAVFKIKTDGTPVNNSARFPKLRARSTAWFTMVIASNPHLPTQSVVLTTCLLISGGPRPDRLQPMYVLIGFLFSKT